MAIYKLGKRSTDNLKGVHPSLVRVVRRAIELTEVDFTVTEGLRSWERQKELFDAKKSWTMKSRHLQGYAVDLMAYGVTDTWALVHYRKIAEAMKKAAAELAIPLVWGGDWKQVDAVHFELDSKVYK